MTPRKSCLSSCSLSGQRCHPCERGPRSRTCCTGQHRLGTPQLSPDVSSFKPRGSFLLRAACPGGSPRSSCHVCRGSSPSLGPCLPPGPRARGIRPSVCRLSPSQARRAARPHLTPKSGETQPYCVPEEKEPKALCRAGTATRMAQYPRRSPFPGLTLTILNIFFRCPAAVQELVTEQQTNKSPSTSLSAKQRIQPQTRSTKTLPSLAVQCPLTEQLLGPGAATTHSQMTAVSPWKPPGRGCARGRRPGTDSQTAG